MADQATTTPATEPTAPTTNVVDAKDSVSDPAQAVSTPAAKPQGAAPSINDLKAARREKAAAPKAHAQPAPEAAGSTSSASTSATSPSSSTGTAAQPAAADPPKTAQINMDDDSLKSFANLQRTVRELQTKLTNAEDRVKNFGKFEKAQNLAKEGKHYDAAREAGIDVDAALAELLQQNPNGATATQIDKKLQEEIAELKSFKDEIIKERADRKAADTAAAQEQGRSVVVKFVGDNATKYPYLSKAPDLVKSALDEADKAYDDAKKALSEGEDLTDEDKNKILFKHLESHEAKWAKAFGPATPKVEEPPATVVDGARAGVRQPVPESKKVLTFEELKAERAARRIAERAKVAQ